MTERQNEERGVKKRTCDSGTERGIGRSAIKGRK